MTKDRGPDCAPPPIEEWFSSRGFRIAISENDGVVWAALVSTTNGVVVPRYGRGHDPVEAAERARERYLEEQ
jgi:hypothetical protein